MFSNLPNDFERLSASKSAEFSPIQPCEILDGCEVSLTGSSNGHLGSFDPTGPQSERWQQLRTEVFLLDMM